jgi:hypothetical protein
MDSAAVEKVSDSIRYYCEKTLWTQPRSVFISGYSPIEIGYIYIKSHSSYKTEPDYYFL